MISGCWRSVAVAGAALLLSSASGAATFLVDSVLDEIDVAPGDGVCATGLGSCTLRAAIMEANAWEGADQVNLPAGTYSLNMVSQEGWYKSLLFISSEVTITGAGASETAIDGGGVSRIFSVGWGDLGEGMLSASSLTLRGGVGSGSALYVWTGNATLDDVIVEENQGCSIYTDWDFSSIWIRSSLIRDNAGCGVGNYDAWVVIEDSVIERNQGIGIGLASDGRITVRRTIVRENEDTGIRLNCSSYCSGLIEESAIIDNISAVGAGGVDLRGQSDIWLRNTTISGNNGTLGGGIAAVSLSSFLRAGVTVDNSTISGNSALEGGGLALVSPGLDGPGTLGILRNSVVAGNSSVSGPDCLVRNNDTEEWVLSSGGHNVVGVACEGLAVDSTDLAGGAEHPVEALLAPLADNGGPTPTHALLYGSPAIDAGDPDPPGQVGACTAFDQRGVPRPVDGNADGVSRCDIGAFEAREPFVLTSGADGEDVNAGDGVCAAASGYCTLRAAVTEANARPGSDRILAPPGTYSVHLEEAGLGGISIVDDLEILGSTAGRVLLTCSNLFISETFISVFSRVLLSDLAIGECNAADSSLLIKNQGGDLTLDRVEVIDFFTSQVGAIWSSSGNLVIRDSFIGGNQSEGATLLVSGGTARIENTKIDDNHSFDPLIRSPSGTLVIDRSTITRNGCGEYACVLSAAGDVTIRDSLIALNGGGMTMSRGLIENSTISGNLSRPGVHHALIRGTAEVSVRNSTIARNEIPDGSALFGVFVANSIVAENTPAGFDCSGVTSGGHNLFGTGCASSSLQPSDLLGSEAVPLVPMLAPLRNYGGPTNSHALLIGSPALDAGDPSPLGSSPTACLATDQRGTPRNGDGDGDGVGRCDIGAYELREACGDLEDNDGDGSVDALDAGCQNVAATTESPKCQDGIDNDGDGKFDFDGGASANGGVALGEPDPQCGGVAWKTKEAASCGIGVELSGVLFLLHLARRRRRWVERVSLP